MNPCNTYVNFYKCVCSCEWVGLSDSECNERCPECRREVEPTESYEAGSLRNYAEKLGDLQRLCERAYMEIDKNFEKLCDSDGFGPMSLVSDLAKVKNGGEYRELRSTIEVMHKALKKSEDEILHLKGLR